MCSMSGEDEEGEEREGSRSLRRLVMKALVEKRDTERVPQLDGALYLQLLLMMRLHCRDETKWGGGGNGKFMALEAVPHASSEQNSHASYVGNS